MCTRDTRHGPMSPLCGSVLSDQGVSSLLRVTITGEALRNPGVQALLAWEEGRTFRGAEGFQRPGEEAPSSGSRISGHVVPGFQWRVASSSPGPLSPSHPSFCPCLSGSENTHRTFICLHGNVHFPFICNRKTWKLLQEHRELVSADPNLIYRES